MKSKSEIKESFKIHLFQMNREMSFASILKQILTKHGLLLIFNNFWLTLKSNFKSIFKIVFLFIVFLFAVLVIAVKSGIEPSDLSRDYSGVYHLEPYVGMLSSLGIFIWCASVTLCWFSWYFLRMRNPNSGRKNFFFVSGLITAIIAIDDLFQFHEIIIPDYFGIPEISFYIAYTLILIVFNIKYVNTLMNKNFSVLIASYFFLAISIVFDVFFEETVAFGTYIEDGLKFIGIALWSIYFFKTVLVELSGAIEEEPRI
ncbi:MAG: hypothetical protein ACKVQV_10150 [Bacteroidia bacterium]